MYTKQDLWEASCTVNCGSKSFRTRIFNNIQMIWITRGLKFANCHHSPCHHQRLEQTSVGDQESNTNNTGQRLQDHAGFRYQNLRLVMLLSSNHGQDDTNHIHGIPGVIFIYVHNLMWSAKLLDWANTNIKLELQSLRSFFYQYYFIFPTLDHDYVFTCHTKKENKMITNRCCPTTGMGFQPWSIEAKDTLPG